MPAALADTSQIICEVWASNVDEEMRKIRQIIQNYNYIAMVYLSPFCSEVKRSGVRNRTVRYKADDSIRRYACASNAGHTDNPGDLVSERK